MSLPLSVRPAAEQDLAEARDWYESRQPDLGQAFLQAVDEVFNRVAASPELYADEYRGVRRAGLSRFPYIVYFRLTANCVEILAVLHGSRHSREWRSRTV